MKMIEQMEIKRLSESIIYELQAMGAWCAHAYGFEYMSDYYYKVVYYLDKLKLDSSALRKSFENASAEYDSIVNNEHRSFMNWEDTKTLDEYDRIFIDKLSDGCIALEEYLGIKIEEEV